MFEKDVYSSYQDFVGKAAFCRNFTWDQANEVAQGRYVRQALLRIKEPGKVLSYFRHCGGSRDIGYGCFEVMNG